MLQVELALVLLVAHNHLVFLDEGSLLQLHTFFLGEGQHLGLGYYLGKMANGNGVIGIKDKTVFAAKVLYNPEFGTHVVFHLVVVTVKMVGGDIGYDGNVRVEVLAVVQLEAAYLQNVVVVLFGGYLIGVACTYVASQTYVKAGLLKKVVNKGGGSCLAVTSGDADFLGTIVPSCKFYLRYNVYSFFLKELYHGGGGRYAGAFYNLVGVEDKFLCVTTLLEGDVPLPKHFQVFVRYLAVVRQKHIKAFDFSKHGGSYAAFRSAQYNKS